MITLLQTIGQVAEQSACIAETDPHGIIISTVSVTAVFIALLILFLAYLCIGKCVRAVERRQKESATETEPVEYLSDKPEETGIITIRRKPKVTISRKEDISGFGKNILISEEPVPTRSYTSNDGIVRSPLPGVITSLKANVSEQVSIGAELAVLEAMKMENTIESEYSGTVVEIYVSKGDSVLEGTPLMRIQ